MFTEEQKRIFDGLNEIGEEISNFYTDALRLIDDSCAIESKANLIAHLAREIDGGLRDIFAPELLKKERQKEIKGIENAGHFASILASLGRDKEDRLANEWFDIANKFVFIAHRHGPWKETKAVDEIISLWKRYEKILLSLVGSFYGIIDRLNHIIELEVPTSDILGFLSNILQNPKYEFHFFTRLKQVKWVSYLKNADYFKSANAPQKDGNNLYPNEWIPIRFLLNAAKEKNKDAEKEIIDIYKDLCQEYLENKFDLHPYTITILAEILIELDTYAFSAIDKKVFEKFVSTNPNTSWNLHESYLTEQLPQVYITRGEKEGLKHLLTYSFGFNVFYPDSEGLSKLGFAPYPQIRYFLDDYHLRTFVDKYSKDIFSILGIEGIHHAVDVIKKTAEIDSFKFSSSAIPSVELSDQSRYANNWESNIVRFVVNGLMQFQNEEVLSLISDYLFSDIEIIRRIAFHIINEKFDVFRDVFFDFMDKNTLNDSIPTHEPYILLREKSTQFSNEEFGIIIHWIENIEVQKYSEEETDDQLLNYRFYKIRKWLSSLNPTNESQKSILEAKRNHYDSLDKTKIEHPEFDSYSKSSLGPNYPITLADFENKSLKEQVDFINNFLPNQNHFHSDEGLGDILKVAFIRNPTKYLFSLDAFVKMHSLYLHNLVDAFTKVLNDGQITDFLLLIDFLEKKISDNSFKYEIEKSYSYKKWFVSRVGTFTEALATKDDMFDFTKDDLSRIFDLLIGLLEESEFKDCDEKVTHDYITHILNSTQGRLHMGLVEVTNTWTKKYAQKEDKIKWPQNVKDYFTKRLERKTLCDKDFSFILGYYFPNLIYFDKSWVIENLSKIFPKDDEIHFEYTLSCCLSSYSRQYKDVFEILKDSSIVKSALCLYNNDCGPLGSIMNYALLEYSYWGVDLNSEISTLSWIFQKGEVGHIEKLIEMIWKSKFLFNEKLKVVWDKILNIVSSQPEKYRIASKNLSWFVDCINELKDEYAENLHYSINCFEENDSEGYSLIRGIFKLADTNLKNAGVLVAETIKKANLGPFFDRGLYDFVEKLFQNNLQEIANKICFYVGEKGQLTLKELYDNYNS